MRSGASKSCRVSWAAGGAQPGRGNSGHFAQVGHAMPLNAVGGIDRSDAQRDNSNQLTYRSESENGPVRSGAFVVVKERRGATPCTQCRHERVALLAPFSP